MRIRTHIPWLLALACAAPAGAVLVDTPDPRRNERAPEDDPGWRNVGRRGGTSAIYLGGGWVLTARHSGLGEVEFDGTLHPPVASSLVWLESPEVGGQKADLILFRVDPAPELPALPLATRSPKEGSEVVVVGYGSGRGAPLAGGSTPGFRIDRRMLRRWGTNRVEPGRTVAGGPFRVMTRCFEMKFLRGGSAYEAQATVGDSGGAVFVRDGGGWALAGVMLSVNHHPGQKNDEVLFGNATFAADLSAYASQIERVVSGAAHAPR